MPDIRDRDHLRAMAADMRRLAAQHAEGGNPEISKKLTTVAAALEVKADNLADCTAINLAGRTWDHAGSR